MGNGAERPGVFHLRLRAGSPGFWFVLIALSVLPLTVTAESEKDFDKMRRNLVEEIADEVRLTSEYLNKRELDKRVMDAIGRVPRHELVPKAVREQSYGNFPLPIGYGQTISQPYVVAVMTDMLEIRSGDRVLEVGTGSGYQAAVIAELGATVYTIEIIEELAASAKTNLARLGYHNVHIRHADGYYGWEEHAPYDAIIITAATSHIPPPLIEQLRPGGKMMLPLGGQFMTQHLVLVDKSADGEITTRQILPVRFVPLTGDR